MVIGKRESLDGAGGSGNGIGNADGTESGDRSDTDSDSEVNHKSTADRAAHADPHRGAVGTKKCKTFLHQASLLPKFVFSVEALTRASGTHRGRAGLRGPSTVVDVGPRD